MDSRRSLSHLLRRAGFGAEPGEIDRRMNQGYEATVAALIESGAVPDGLDELDRQIGGILDFNNADDVRCWWLYRMAHSGRPLVEKMAFFWHGHFATSVSKFDAPYLMYLQNQLFREHGLGSFHELLLRVSQDAAMLYFLDGAYNRKSKPNENYAREIIELFTIGIGHYTEKDVQEAARAFTGWNLRDDAFFFNAGEHDSGEKTFLGNKGNLDGSDVVRILAEHPATAERMTSKLFAFFVYEEPSKATLAPFVKVWTDSRGSVREVLRAIFLSKEFRSDRAWRARLKSPAELVIGAIRSLGGTFAPRPVVNLMRSMGQDLFNPPSVKGWDGGLAWISTSSIFERMNFAASITTARGPSGTSHIAAATVFGGVAPTTTAQMLDLALEHLVDGEVPEKTRAALLAYLDTPDPSGPKDGKGVPFPALSNPAAFDEKARGLLHLILSAPEYQVS